MSIDEALKQLSFVERKGSAIVKEVNNLRPFICHKLRFCMLPDWTVFDFVETYLRFL